ncbi:MAG: hypothetical protein AB7O37_05060 [Vicinamibacteria bacterium]
MPARRFRLRVGGLTLSLGPVPAGRFRPPVPVLQRFSAKRGGDLALQLVDEAPPVPAPGSLLFESGGPWRVHRHRRGLLYLFRSPAFDPNPFKAVWVDARMRRGVLYAPPLRRPRLPPFPLDYPLDELLFDRRLAAGGGLMMHACGLVQDGRALLFAGISGAGKSTTARLWHRLRPGTPILSDDRVMLRPRGGGFRAYGTPWHGDGGFGHPLDAPLGAVFLIRHARRSRARRLAPAEAAARIFARSFTPPWDRRLVARALASAARVALRTPCYDFGVRPDASAIAAALEAFRSAGRGSSTA